MSQNAVADFASEAQQLMGEIKQEVIESSMAFASLVSISRTEEHFFASEAHKLGIPFSPAVSASASGQPSWLCYAENCEMDSSFRNPSYVTLMQQSYGFKGDDSYISSCKYPLTAKSGWDYRHYDGDSYSKNHRFQRSSTNSSEVFGFSGATTKSLASEAFSQEKESETFSATIKRLRLEVQEGDKKKTRKHHSKEEKRRKKEKKSKSKKKEKKSFKEKRSKHKEKKTCQSPSVCSSRGSSTKSSADSIVTE